MTLELTREETTETSSRLFNSPKTKSQPVVNSFNEWDCLEEVIVGIVDYATIPPWHLTVQSTVPSKHENFIKKFGGQPFPQELVQAANKELDQFAKLLNAEGVIVKRPNPVDNTLSFNTPDWQSPSGLYQAMPRDLLLVIGDMLIEAPMAWRSRYYEINGYRNLLKDYFQLGARWISAPKPQLTNALYNFDYVESLPGPQREYAITEFEPTFDAADFTRCGKDIFVQKSNVTNSFGIEWLRRHIGNQYTIHELEFYDSHPMHIDATLVPLAPGHVLVNPERVSKLPIMVDSWNVIYAPPSCIPQDHPLYMSSSWLSMNILMLDEKRVVVEESEEPLIKLFKENGFQPITCSFRNFNSFGGSFHCATLDVRRNGTLQSYF